MKINVHAINSGGLMLQAPSYNVQVNIFMIYVEHNSVGTVALSFL